MHILIGALLGGLIGCVLTVAMTKAMGKKITWGVVVGGFLGGAVSGALAATTLGTSLVAAGGVRAVTFLAVEGASGSATGRIAQNLVDHNPVMEKVATNAVLGAVTGPLGYVGGRIAGKVLPEKVTAKVLEVAEKLPLPVRTGFGMSVSRRGGAAAGLALGVPAATGPPVIVTPGGAPAAPVSSGLAATLTEFVGTP